MSRTALALAALLCACSPDAQRVGAFDVSWTAEPPALVVRSGSRELLRSAAPFLESRATSATWESQFGSYRVTEGNEKWAAIDALGVDEAGASKVVLTLEREDAADGTLTITSPKAGVLELALSLPGPADRARARFDCAAGDHFLGFGGQADATDHRGHKLPMWVSEPGIGKTEHDDPEGEAWFFTGTRHASSYPMPTFLSSRGFAFLADTTRRAVFDVCQARPDAWSVEAWDRAVTLRVYDGPNPAAAIERLTADIGRQPLANDLAFAPWNDAIFGSAEVRKVAKLLRDSRIPSGALWTEDFRGADVEGENYRLKEEWDIDRALYPDVEALASELHGQGFRWLAYHNTFLTSDTRIIAAARAADVLVKKGDGGEYLFTGVKFTPTGLVDLTHPKAADFVRDPLKALLGLGFDGFMTDYGEWLPPDAILADGSDAEAVHNEYPRRYFERVAEAMTAHPDANAQTFFARAGSLRTAPFQPVVWAGDQFTSFARDDGLPTVVTMGLNLGLSGISTYGHDIGGYQNALLPPSTKELFFRWTTVGALSPVMRTHHGTKAKLNWWFGKDAETIAHYQRWSRFHARLWPYFRAAAKDAFEHGLPIMRHLALAFPDDPKSWKLDDEYLLGPSLLVAPVLVEGATSRDVHFPAGAWMPFFSGESATAGDASIAVPLTEAGLFARPGTIVAMLPDTFDTLMPADPPLRDLDDVKQQRSLVVFGGASGEWVDLDGTRFTLESSSHDAPLHALVGGVETGACEETSTSCVEFDGAARTVVVRGANLSDVELRTATGAVARVRSAGALTVGELTYRY